MEIKLKVWGDYALFARPEFKVERVTYDVMPPSVARNILQAIYWHKGVEYVIDSIRVLKPIRHINIRRNEVRSVISCVAAKKQLLSAEEEMCLYTAKDRSQRTGLILKNVAYVIEAHIRLTSNANFGKNEKMVHSIFVRRASRGQCFTRPYLGNREFPAFFELVEDEDFICPESLLGTKELGRMFYDMDYQDDLATKDFVPECIPMFFDATLVNGVLRIPSVKSEVVDCGSESTH